MQRFLPTLAVLILIFGVRPLQFLMILAIVVVGMAWQCHSTVPHEDCTWCHWMRSLGRPTPKNADDRING